MWFEYGNDDFNLLFLFRGKLSISGRGRVVNSSVEHRIIKPIIGNLSEGEIANEPQFLLHFSFRNIFWKKTRYIRFLRLLIRPQKQSCRTQCSRGGWESRCFYKLLSEEIKATTRLKAECILFVFGKTLKNRPWALDMDRKRFWTEATRLHRFQHLLVAFFGSISTKVSSSMLKPSWISSILAQAVFLLSLINGTYWNIIQ